MTENEANNIFCATINSATSNSVRRIFFQSFLPSLTDFINTNDSRMYTVFGGGSSILLKYNHSILLLTCKHVLENQCIDYKTETESASPFWVHIQSEFKETAYFLSEMQKFLMPHKYIYVDEDINKNFIDNNPKLNVTDFILVQMFDSFFMNFGFSQKSEDLQPFLRNMKFIDLDSHDVYLKENEFYEGQDLIFSGYPQNENHFKYLESNEPNELVCETINFKRYIFGNYEKEDPNNKEEFGYLRIHSESNQNINHDDMVGMSGGIVTNVDVTSQKVKWAGMGISMGNGIIRFIPAFIIVNCLTAKPLKLANFKYIDMGSAPEAFDRSYILRRNFFTKYQQVFSQPIEVLPLAMKKLNSE